MSYLVANDDGLPSLHRANNGFYRSFFPLTILFKYFALRELFS